MTNERTPAITAANVEALAGKLEGFGRSLPPGELEAFTGMLQRAATTALAESEVQGYFTLIDLTLSSHLINAALSFQFGGSAALLPAVQRAHEG